MPSNITGAAIVGSMVLLARASRSLPIGTAYAISVGMGVVGASIGAAVLFNEPMPPLRIAFLALLLVTSAGLKMTAPGA